MEGVEAVGSDARDENANHCKNKVVVFNHREVTLVPVSGYERFTLVVQTNCMRLMQQ